MGKTTSKRTSKNLKLYILNHIKLNNSLPKDISHNVIKYHLLPFQKSGLVEKIGYGTWELTKLGLAQLDLKQLQILRHNTSLRVRNSKLDEIRGHGFMWRLKLPFRAYCSSSKRVHLCECAGYDYSVLKTGVVKLILKTHKVHLAERSIIVYFNNHTSYIGNTAKDSYLEALFEFKKLIHTLERAYSISLKIRGAYKFKVLKNHYGNLNNEFAINYRKRNTFLRVFDEGKEWLIIDFSDKKHIELETTATGRAKYDQDNVIIPTMNTLRHDPHILARLQKENLELKMLISSNQKILKYLLEKDGTSIDIDRFKY